MAMNSANSVMKNEMLSGKTHHSEMLPKHRKKRFWTAIRPNKRDYPDFDDDREGEEYYRNVSRSIVIPNVHNFTVKFTFIIRPTTTTKVRLIANKTKPINKPENTTQSTIRKLQNVTKEKKSK
uniref:Uncharacterized protein n=1 Tax=Onchocerca volvulus TaxID=6282 RepID=A0A2K6VS90_ONCVO